MTRFNYLAARGPTFAARSIRVAIDNRIRGPLAALLATVVLSAALGAVQLIRLHAAQAAYARATIRLVAAQAAVRSIEAQRQRLIRRTRLSDYVANIRRASLAHSNELTWIGNRLPARTWLRTLRYENGRYSLEGTCDRAATVGTVLLALHDEAHAAVPQLVSLHDDRSAATGRVHFTLRLQTQ